MAAQWIDAIRYAYKNKGLDGEIYHPVVKATGSELVKGVDKGYGDIDYDSPDFLMREYLKRNVWKFSVAKNYNDCIRLSNLLVRPDGSLRPWNEFKKEAMMVVGASNRYLQTEYNTIVAGAQMTRKWQQIQAQKHIFPYVQFSVVLDDHTSDICEPLHNVICAVDDPMMAYFFPPNHFNCRTDVRQLRYGVPTKNVEWPEIPEAFKNNPGISGQIFTDKSSYIQNTPAELYKDISFYKEDGVYISHRAKKTSKSEKELLRIEAEYNNRIKAAKSLHRYFDKKKIVSVMPEIRNDHWAYDIHFKSANERKTPDYTINEEFWELESYENEFSFRKLNKMLKHGYDQADNIIIKFNHDIDVEKIKYHLENRYKTDAKRIIFLNDDFEIIFEYKKAQ